MIENAALRNMKERFTCRKYLNKPVEKEKIQACLEAAKYAPSGLNKQGWHFTIIQSQEGKELLLKAAGSQASEGFKKMMPDKEWPWPRDFFGAPLILLISGRTDVPWPNTGPQLAAGNFMNAAASLGLATMWSTLFTNDLFRDDETRKLKKLFMPEENQMYAALFVGYPETIPAKRPKRREDVETWL